MHKLLSITILIFIVQLSIVAQESFSLTINVDKIIKVEGTLMTCLVTDQSEYLSNCKNGQATPVQSKTEQVVFSNLKAGSYCVTICHDEDDNGQLNTKGLFGMPSEPYGFSNNPKGFMGPPKYKKCTFDLNGDMEILVKL